MYSRVFCRGIMVGLLFMAVFGTVSVSAGDDKVQPVDIEQVYQAGVNHYDAGRFDKAIEEWESVFRISKDYKDIAQRLMAAYKYAGMELYGGNRQAEAIDIWEKALKLDPNNNEIKDYINRARGEEKALAVISGTKSDSTMQIPLQTGKVETLVIPVKQDTDGQVRSSELKALADSVNSLSNQVEKLRTARDSTKADYGLRSGRLSGYIAADAYNEPDNERWSFELNQVEVDLTKNFSDRALLRADLDYIPDDSGAYRADIEQAHVSARYGNSPEWWLTFGKFNAPVGSESPDASGLSTISHSLIYEYGRPVNVTGLMISSKLSPGFRWLAYVVNGWDRNFDVDNDKTFGAAMRFGLGGDSECGISMISGNEQDTISSSRRTVLDLDLSVNPLSSWGIKAEFNRGIETEAAPDSTDAEWIGLYVLSNLKIDDHYALAFRFDYLNDNEGVRTGYNQELKSIAAVPAFTIMDGVTAMVELKYDFSNRGVFSDADGSMNDSRFSAGFRITGLF